MIDLNLLNIYGRRWFKLASKGKNTMLFWDTAKHHISWIMDDTITVFIDYLYAGRSSDGE